MKLNIYSIFDRKAKAYLPPFYLRSLDEAKRAFAGIATDQSSMFWKFPEDFSLWQLGIFDDNTGEIQAAVDGPLDQALVYTAPQGVAGQIQPKKEQMV